MIKLMKRLPCSTQGFFERIVFLVLLSTVASLQSAYGDWAAYNNQGQAGNVNDTTYTIASLGTASGSLKDAVTGAALAAKLTITTNGTGSPPVGAATMSAPPAGTPAALVFGSYINWTPASNPGIQLKPGVTITYAFSGLDPAKRYRFAGSSVRGGSGGDYGVRWTQAELAGALSYTAAHSANVITAAQFPASLTGNQVAWNSGINSSGDLVEWDNIAPASNGTFSIRIIQYTGGIPGGSVGAGPYCYAFQAIRLEEIAITGALVQITQPANNSIALLPATIPLAASVSGFSGTVTNVSFFSNLLKIGQSTTAPFTCGWSNATPGGYVLTSIAKDNTGITRTSAPVVVIIKGNLPPAMTILSPADGAVLPAGQDIQIDALASDSDGWVASVQYFANNTLIGQNTNSPWSLIWPAVPAGTYELTAVATDDRGASTTSTVAHVIVIKSTAPTVDSLIPEPGLVSNFNQLTVNFSTPVVEVDASDLLINGVPATNVTGSGSTYTFSFATPREGSVSAAWSPKHGIVDLETPPKPFNGMLTNETAAYTLIDTVPPRIASTSPLSGVTLSSLNSVDITFSEPVTGIDAADLLVNGVPATKVTGSLSGPYHFSFTQPAAGPVALGWAANHGIHDFAAAANPFAASSWSYTLDTSKAQNNVVISEIMFHPPSDLPKDQYIELHNKGATDVNLSGWQFSKGIPFTFPAITLSAHGYLVVAADLAAFQTNYPDASSVIGGWTGWMSSHLELRDAADNTVSEVKYGTSGDWGIRERGATREKVVSITRNGSTATVTLYGNYNTGDTFTISGADQPEYNGTFTMTSVSAAAPYPCVTFNYTVSGSPATPATGMIVCHQISDCGHTGWAWTSPADGFGSSLELLEEGLPNQYAQNWGFSSGHGTPGQPNSQAKTNLAPMILNVGHYPLVPTSTNPVTITARLLDEQTNGINATLYWRVDASPANTFQTVPMHDDGAHGDGAANDGVFGAIIPAQANNAVVEFYVQATDIEGAARTWPAPALETNGVPVQAANALYQVDNTVYTATASQPMFRLTMRDVDRAELATFPSASPWSNCKFNLSVIAIDGIDSEVRYLCDVRDRGAGTRQKSPCNHEISFTDDHPWHGVTSINLNTQFTESQYMGYVLAMLGGLDTEAARIVQVRVNNVNRANAGSPQFGSYIQLQRTDNDYVKNHWPGESGNIYRGQSFSHSCNLAYHGAGSTWLDYARDGYSKQNNTVDNDWSDLINLCRVLDMTNVSDATYEQNVRGVVDVEQWMRYFAVYNMSASLETAFATGVGDDYSLYRRNRDNRWMLMGHDWDTILGEGDTAGQTNMPLFIMCPSVPFSTFTRNTTAMDRFMKHPSFAPIYYSELKRLCDSVFAPAQMNATLDRSLGSWVSTSSINNMKNFNAGRWAYVVSQIPLNLTVNTTLSRSNLYWRATTPTITLNGQANAISTRSVTVNGSPSIWSAWEARWTNSYTLTPGINHLLIEARDSSGSAIASANLDVWLDTTTGTTVGGSIAANQTWTKQGSPYNVTSSISIENGATLAIQAGTTVYLASGVNLTIANGGRLLAEGTAVAPISFASPANGSTAWGGITINGIVGSPETRIAYAFFQGNGSTCIEVAGGTLWLDHATFLTTTHQYVSLDNSSFVLSRCHFPPTTAQFEPLHGTGGIKTGGRGIVRECYFGATSGYNDIMDFTGGNRDLSQPIIQYYNNVFVGASDDILDLDGTDAWIEGNIFLHSHRNNSPDSSSAISGGNYDFGGSSGVRTSEITAIGNLFFDCDNVATAKEGDFFTFLNNTIIHTTKTGGQDFASGIVNEGDTTPSVTAIGRGFYLEGNVIWDAEQLVRNYDPANTLVTFTNNILPFAWTGPGAGNLVANPLLKHIPQVSETTNFLTWEQAQVMWDWFSLQKDSPAIGTGPNGRDKGALVPPGVSVSGEPLGTTLANSAKLTIASVMSGSGIPAAGFPNGSGFTHYKWKLNNGSWSAETPMTAPLLLSNLSNGPHFVTVIGKNDAGYYQNDALLGTEAVETVSKVWIVNTNAPTLGLSEILARNVAAVPVGGNYPDLIELQNWGGTTQSLAGMSITDDLGNPRKYVFASDLSINPGAFLVLFADDASTPAGVHLGFKLAQEGGAVYLFTGDGQLLDSIAYGPQVPDLSIGRLADGAWALTHPTFGFANIAAELGDPRALKINEWLTASATSSPFVELFNGSSLPVSLAGLFLTDNLIGAPALHPIAPLSFAPAGGYVMFLADGDPNSGPSHLRFSLPTDRGEIALSDSALNLIDRVLYGPQSSSVSQGRSPSGSSNIVSFTTPTPLAANQAPAQPGGQLVINEIVTKNRTGLTGPDGSAVDWLELYNPTAAAIDLADLSLSDQSSAPRKWVFPSGTTVASAGYLIVVCDPNLAPSTNNAGILNTGFALTQNGGSIYLFDKLSNGGAALDGLTYGIQADDLSIGRVPSGSTNWVLNLPTPGAANIAAQLGDPARLKINEWMANPSTGEKWFEIYNPNAQPVVLSGLSLRDDVHQNTIAPLSFIGTGLSGYARFWLDKNPAAGPDHLSFGVKASGGVLGIFSAAGNQIDYISFGAQLADVSQGRLPDGSSNIVSFISTASPGDANYLALTNIVINEVLSAPAANPPKEQAIELLNAGTTPVDISGWYLGNLKHDLMKFQIPPNSILQPGQFRVFYGTDFNYQPDNQPRLWLDAVNGDHLYLSQTAPDGSLTGYRGVAAFGPSAPGVSFGRYTNSVGKVEFVAMTQTTFGVDNPVSIADFRTGTGAPNARPLVGPVVFNEIMYDPSAVSGTNDNTADEYAELMNITANQVPLYDPAAPTNTWQVNGGISYTFPANITIPAGGLILLVNFDPVTNATMLAEFRSRYGVGPTVPLFGPYGGHLANSGESIALYRPIQPQPQPIPSGSAVPYVLVEEVAYSNTAPWPSGANATGLSLQRTFLNNFGDDPANWYVSIPTAGQLNGAQNVDSNADGLPDPWQILYFGSISNPDAAPDADPDHDGLTNMQEYLAGTNPTDPTSNLNLRLARPVTDSFSIQFNAVAGKTYTLWYRNGLSTGTWTKLTNVAAQPQDGPFTVKDSALGTQTRFYRLSTP